MSFELAKPTAVSDVVYDWLARDLGRLGIAHQSDGNAARHPRTVWDIDPQPWSELASKPT
jgi:hypothetical protein